LLYSPAPRPVCVAIPSGSHCDASSAPRPVLIPRARAEMLGPLCVRSAQVSIGPVPSAGPPCGWLRRRLTLECPLAVPAMGLISSAPVCVSPGSVPYRKVPAKSGACEICATEFRAPTTRSIMFTRTALPTHCECPRRGEGFDPAAGTSLTRRPITLVYFPFPHCTVPGDWPAESTFPALHCVVGWSPRVPMCVSKTNGHGSYSPMRPTDQLATTLNFPLRRLWAPGSTSRSSTRLFPKHSPLASPPPLSFPISRYLLPVLTSLGTATGVRISFG